MTLPSCLRPLVAPCRVAALGWLAAAGAAGALPLLALLLAPPLLRPPAARAAEPAPVVADAAVQALVGRAEQACREGLARRFAVPPASVDLWLTPGLRIAIEAGEADLAGLRREGLAFGWMLPQKPAPAPIGLCRTSGAGAVVAIEQQPD